MVLWSCGIAYYAHANQIRDLEAKSWVAPLKKVFGDFTANQVYDSAVDLQAKSIDWAKEKESTLDNLEEKYAK